MGGSGAPIEPLPAAGFARRNGVVVLSDGDAGEHHGESSDDEGTFLRLRIPDLATTKMAPAPEIRPAGDFCDSYAELGEAAVEDDIDRLTARHCP